MEARRANREAVIAAIAEVLQTSDARDWTARLASLGVVAAEVSTLENALENDQVQARRMVVDIPAGDATIRAIGNPLKIAGQVETFQPPPLLGEHDELLAEIAPS